MLDKAIEIAVENVLNGGGPFGAVIVMPNGKLYTGVNRVTDLNDPTAHAEVTAIRNACKGEGTFDITGAILYTSCEPCPMCLGAALWSRIAIEDIIFAADRHDAADAGFDDAEFYKVLAEKSPTLCKNVNKLSPFDTWRGKIDKTEY